MNLKALTKESAEVISSFHNKHFPDGWNLALLLSAFDTGRFKCVGAFIKDQLVGLITYSIGIDDADIEGIIVSEEFRRRGVANKLFEFALLDIKNNGVEKLLLEVRASNSPAISFYKSKGFTQISVRKKYYPDGEDALIFVKEI